jgi:hypothetical protein
MPVSFVVFTSGQRDGSGAKVIGDATYTGTRATLTVAGSPDRHYDREAGESFETFASRIVGDVPIRDESLSLWAENGGLGIGGIAVIFWPSAERGVA